MTNLISQDVCLYLKLVRDSAESPTQNYFYEDMVGHGITPNRISLVFDRAERNELTIGNPKKLTEKGYEYLKTYDLKDLKPEQPKKSKHHSFFDEIKETGW